MKLSRVFSVFMLVILLSACQAPLDTGLSEVALQQEPMTLSVSRIEILPDIEKTSGKHVEGEMPTPPLKALTDWAGKNLKAGGSASLMRINVTQASVIESKKAVMDKQLWEFYRNDNQLGFEATLQVQFKVYTPPSLLPVAEAEITVTRMMPLAEDASLFTRNEMYNRLISDLMADFHGEAQKQLREYFAEYVEG